MRLIIAAVGRLKAGAERDLVERYLSRSQKLARSLGIKSIESIELTESRARNGETRKTEEATALLEKLPEETLIIACDERGTSPTSPEFAAWMLKARDSNTACLALVIGGADGLAETIRKRAKTVISFGHMTLPHQIVRVLVTEQIYRALTQLSGHPYHRE